MIYGHLYFLCPTFILNNQIRRYEIMKSIKIILILCIFLFINLLTFFVGCSDTASSVSDTTSTIWTKENSPYIITDTVYVDYDETLIIEPGTIIKFERYGALIVNGTLKAEGNKKDSIIFTSASENKYISWQGIHFDNCSDNSILKYCIVEYGGEFCIVVTNSSPTISHCWLRHILPGSEMGGEVIFCRDNSSPLIKHCVISDFFNYRSVGIACYLSNPIIYQNDILCCDKHTCHAVLGGGFLNGNYLAKDILRGDQVQYISDASFGIPIDKLGDGICNTTSTDSLKLFVNVDGVKNPRNTPNFSISIK